MPAARLIARQPVYSHQASIQLQMPASKTPATTLALLGHTHPHLSWMDGFASLESAWQSRRANLLALVCAPIKRIGATPHAPLVGRHPREVRWTCAARRA